MSYPSGLAGVGDHSQDCQNRQISSAIVCRSQRTQLLATTHMYIMSYGPIPFHAKTHTCKSEGKSALTCGESKSGWKNKSNSESGVNLDIVEVVIEMRVLWCCVVVWRRKAIPPAADSLSWLGKQASRQCRTTSVD